jgi:hypothetical protein
MFQLKFSLANEAFDNLMSIEIARILREIAKQVERGADPANIRDINGNTIGKWQITAR